MDEKQKARAAMAREFRKAGEQAELFATVTTLLRPETTEFWREVSVQYLRFAADLETV